MKHGLFFVESILLLFFLTNVSALDWKTADCSEIAYNQKTFDLTQLANDSRVFSFVNDEVVNLTVFREGPVFMMSGKVKNNVVTELSCAHRTDATISVYLQQDAIYRLNTASNQLKELIDLKANSGVKVETHSLGASLKVAFGEFVLALTNFLGFTTFF